MLLSELKTGEWSLVIADVALTGVDGPAFVTLRELASVLQQTGGRIRVLFLVPELTQHPIHCSSGSRAPSSRSPSLPPSMIFLEKVSDLLVEVKSDRRPIRQVATNSAPCARRRAGRQDPTPCSLRATPFSYTDEELAEYEKQEGELSKSRRNKPRIKPRRSQSLSEVSLSHSGQILFLVRNQHMNTSTCARNSLPHASNCELCPRWFTLTGQEGTPGGFHGTFDFHALIGGLLGITRVRGLALVGRPRLAAAPIVSS